MNSWERIEEHFMGMHGDDLFGCGNFMKSQIHHALDYLNPVIQATVLTGYFHGLLQTMTPFICTFSMPINEALLVHGRGSAFSNKIPSYPQ
jgi:hypothetical protein